MPAIIFQSAKIKIVNRIAPYPHKFKMLGLALLAVCGLCLPLGAYTLQETDNRC